MCSSNFHAKPSMMDDIPK